MTKQEIQERERKLIEMTSAFCAAKLDSDYDMLCQKLIKKLGRKRDVPFQRGKPEIWAAAVVHTIGTLNFLFDKSFEPYVSMEDLNVYFGTNSSTVSNKAHEIRELLNLWHYNSEFSTQRMTQSNPFNNLVMVDGYMLPLNTLPESLQEMVREARASGKDITFHTS
ncbi:MAG TPA: DUF6398 domain-containing protein [Saprospiraceae bacterium]|nr:DUF6398 domain-containing protein [Saprospiraceae bacterium]